MSNFEALGLLPELIRGVESMGWTLPTDVQDEAIPLILGGGDVMIAAETGSGKTGAFCLPLLQALYEHLRGEADVTAKIVLNNTMAGDANAGAADNGGAKNNWVLSAADRDPICAVDAGATGLLVQTRHPRDWAGIRASFGVLRPASGSGSGYYFEATVTDEGLCRVGWTCGSGGSRNLGTDALSYGFGGTGKKSHANKFEDYGVPGFGLNDVIGCAVEYAANGAASLSFSKNGAPLGVAFTVPPDRALLGLFPAVVLKNAEMCFNFGEDPATTPFKFPPPRGCKPIAQATEKERIAASAAAFAPASASAAAAAAAAAAASSSSKSKSASSSSSSSSSSSRSPFAIIFEPVRELALQVSAELAKFTQFLQAPPIRHECFVGGMKTNPARQEESLRGLHIVVGTPAMIAGLVKAKRLDVSDTRVLVLDEADQLVSSEGSNCKREILSIYENMPKHSKGVQVIICSATLHSLEIQQLAHAVTNDDATWVDLKGRDSIPDSVDHVVIVADPRADRSWQQARNSGIRTDGVHAGLNLRPGASPDSPELLSEGLKLLKPSLLLAVIDQFLMDQCMIFLRTQLDCDNLESFLLAVGGGGGRAAAGVGFEKRESGKENPYSCVVLHGGRSPAERARNLDAFKNGEVRFLLCTDVAARGIDVANLPFVINLTLPDRAPETYIHRVGRVGRADARGLAISIVGAEDCAEKVWFHGPHCASRGGGDKRGVACHNTKLVEEGGCCLWFDEFDMLEQIEARLGGVSIPKLDRNSVAQGGAFVAASAAKGRRQVDDGSTAAGQHVRVLRPTVEELARLEVTAQCTYWNVKRSSKWANMLK